MQVSIIFVIVAFITGLLLGTLLLYIKLSSVQKKLRSNGGYLESEKLIRETLQRELKTVYQAKETIEQTLKQRLKEAATHNKISWLLSIFFISELL